MQSVTQKRNDFPFNLFKIIEDYFDSMLEQVTGMKSLILDKETSGISLNM